MISEKLKLVPHLPGSYQMKDKNGVIIYVGKAKDLKNRLSSYFNGRVTGKTKKLVSEIADFEYIVTTSELESFILEINLIKKYDPKYNILLKDDKSYPYIEYKRKPYPTLKVVRYLSVKKRENKHLFGPYVNASAARKMVNLINRLYPLKKCTNGHELCLYYHIHECLGYCVKKISDEEIDKMEKEILGFLNGNDSILINKLMEKIQIASDAMNYELALDLKKDLEYIKVIQEKQRVEISDRSSMDVINYYFDSGFISIEIFFVRSGKLVGGKNKIIPVVSDDAINDIESALAVFYTKNEVPSFIIVNKDLNTEILSEAINTKVITAEKGDKKTILDMAYNNAKINLQNNFQTIQNKLARTSGANEELENLLGIKINRIDSFDNSNLFGTFAVSGMVVFKDGLPSKKDYRKYKVSVDKNDDYNTMKEVTYRRYYRALVEHGEFPDLILVDGGINQIHAVKDTINALHLNIKVCGLVKNDKHRTNELLDGDTLESYKIDYTSNLFHYLTRIQDEVHRFTINYHRELRSKGSIKSLLDNVEGIGDVRKKELMKKYGSAKKINEASIEELDQILPHKVSVYLKNYLESFYNKEDK